MSSPGSQKDKDDKDEPHQRHSNTQLNTTVQDESTIQDTEQQAPSSTSNTATTNGDSSLNKEEGQNGSDSSDINTGSDQIKSEGHSDANVIPKFLKPRDDEDKTDDDSGKSGENSDSADEGISDAGSNSSSGSDNIHKKKKSNRCTVCNKKVGLTGFMCRCGNGPFCSVHRYSDKHNCSFNYREQGALEISKANPLITAAKITKI